MFEVDNCKWGFHQKNQFVKIKNSQFGEKICVSFCLHHIRRIGSDSELSKKLQSKEMEKKDEQEQQKKEKDNSNDTRARSWLCYISDFPQEILVQNSRKSFAQMGLFETIFDRERTENLLRLS